MIKYFKAKSFHASNELDGWLNWMEAKTMCDVLGMTLATPCNVDQSAAILQLLNTKSYNQFWLGMSDSAEEGTWTDVKGDIIIYENWKAGEPNGADRENCATLRKGESGSWNDHVCSTNLQYVCESMYRPVL